MCFWILKVMADVNIGINKIGKKSCSSSNTGTDHACGFICNICRDLADQDPIVTPCGHLYCWPCLYKWISVCSSQSKKPHCPVCMASIKEQKLIPIYGIEKLSLDPNGRSRSVPPAIEIPKRPSPSSSSNRRSVGQIRNAIASALNGTRSSEVFQYMAAVLGGTGLIVLCGGYIWCVCKLCNTATEVCDSIKQVTGTMIKLGEVMEPLGEIIREVCDCIEKLENGWKKVQATCSLGLRVLYCLI